jgi:hypothetical protein
VRVLAQGYASQTLDLGEAAAELGLADPARLRKMLEEQAETRDKLHLEPLTAGKTIPRRTWESLEFGTSPFQQLSYELGLGTQDRTP